LAPAGGAIDSFPNVIQPGSQRGGIYHASLRARYFFSCATNALAWAAFGPSGASFT
jgi:hypothetical protein